MIHLIKTELMKMKRYHILWAGVALMLLTVMLTYYPGGRRNSLDIQLFFGTGDQK